MFSTKYNAKPMKKPFHDFMEKLREQPATHGDLKIRCSQPNASVLWNSNAKGHLLHVR